MLDPSVIQDVAQVDAAEVPGATRSLTCVPWAPAVSPNPTWALLRTDSRA